MIKNAYSKQAPATRHLQGGVLVPVNIVSEGEQYRFQFLKFNEEPSAQQIEQYQSIGADIQGLSEKRPDWLKRLPLKPVDPEKLAQLMNGMVLASTLTPEQKEGLLSKYQPWATGKAVEVGDLRTYEAVIYKCAQGHTTQSDWTPDVTPALWNEATPAGVIPLWTQPDSTNPYHIGDKVEYPEGTVWECTAADANGNNVWEPGVYGWTQV